MKGESFEPSEVPREELQLREVSLEPQGKKKKPAPEGMQLPGRGFEESGYTIKEIFGVLAAGGKEVPDETHGMMLIYDREDEVVARIPFPQFDHMKDAFFKMELAGKELEFFGGAVEKALEEFDADADRIDPKQRGGKLEH